MMEITELFFSLQGEGPWSGRPAVFLRLSGCIEPLCPWCDTMYACSEGIKASNDEIYNKILSFDNDFVVITGGEPFLQWSNGLNLLEKRLMAAGCTIQYETSGKIPIPSDSNGIKICSPKYLDGSWHFALENIHRADLFKFVVSDNFLEVEAFVNQHAIPLKSVWIMPLGATREDQLDLLPSLWEFCVKNKFNFSPRLHTLAFDNKRGI